MTKGSVEGFSEGTDEPFAIVMSVFQSIKSGMNRPVPHQTWSINTESIGAMDINDKETMLGEVHLYGNFEEVNPSGVK